MSKEILKRFGAALRKSRLERNLSEAELGEMVGVDSSYIGAIESGDEDPEIAFVFMLAKALEVQPSDFFEEIEKKG